MSNFNSFRHQKRRQSATPISSFARPVRPFAPLPASTPQLAHRSGREKPGRSARVGYSLEQISLLPSEKKNDIGLPDTLKAGIESFSGLSMDDVQVHYNSSRPAQVQALAYTQGRDIHVGPGQERHLPHELWHVVQQMQGRVRPTVQTRGMMINDDSSLEQEAETMGAKAMERGVKEGDVVYRATSTKAYPQIVQRYVTWTETRQYSGHEPFLVGEAAKVNELEDLLRDSITENRLSRLEDALGIQSLEVTLKQLVKSGVEELVLPRENPQEAAELLMVHLETLHLPKEEKKKAPLVKKRNNPRKNLLDLTPDDTDTFNRITDGQLVNPNSIKFSQDTAGFRYQDPFVLNGKNIETIEQHANELKADRTLAGSTPPIEIVLYKKRIMTLNNRRLKAHQLAGVEIPVKKSKDWIGDVAISRHKNVDQAAPRNNLTLR